MVFCKFLSRKENAFTFHSTFSPRKKYFLIKRLIIIKNFSPLLDWRILVFYSAFSSISLFPSAAFFLLPFKILVLSEKGSPSQYPRQSFFGRAVLSAFVFLLVSHHCSPALDAATGARELPSH